MKIRRWLALLLALALTASIGWLGWSWYSTPVPPDVPLTGVEEEMASMVQEALRAVREEPRSAEAWGTLSLILVANGFNEQAIVGLAQTARLDPRDPRWPCMHGVLLLQCSPGEGIPLLRRALDLTQLPKHRGAILYRLSLALIDEGLFGEAEGCLAELREVEGESVRVRFGAGLLASARGDRAGARESLAPLTENPFTRKRACSLLASLTEGGPELARAYEDRAARLPQDLQWPNAFEEDLRPYDRERMKWTARHGNLKRDGQPGDAVDSLRQAVAKSPDAEGYFLLGLALSERDETEEAAEILRAAIAASPQNVKAQAALAAALLRNGERRGQEADGGNRTADLFRQSLAAADRVLALQGNHALGHLIRGQALRRLGRPEEALRAFREGLVCQPDSADMHLALGETLAEFGRREEARGYLADAVRLAPPGDARARQAMEKYGGLAKPSSKME